MQSSPPGLLLYFIFRFRNPYKPLFAAVTGWGVDATDYSSCDYFTTGYEYHNQSSGGARDGTSPENQSRGWNKLESINISQYLYIDIDV